MVFKSQLFRAVCASVLTLGLATSVNAATLQLDFDVSFGDPLDSNTAAPDGTGPWLTAFFDDGGTAGSVSLTLTVAGTVGTAEVTEVYFNVDSAISGLAGTGPSDSTISFAPTVPPIRADGSGLYDILIDFPLSGNTFGAGDSLTFNFTATDLVASSFNSLSTLELGSTTGPYIAAAKFGSTGVDGEQSDWVGAVPIPGAVWLFGSGLIGLVGLARRKKA